MAGKIIDYKTNAITAATATGYITISSVAGYYKGATVVLINGVQPVIQCVITEVLTGTDQLGICIRNSNAGSVPNYGRSNISAYNGGTIYQHEQLVYNNNDQPLA